MVFLQAFKIQDHDVIHNQFFINYSANSLVWKSVLKYLLIDFDHICEKPFALFLNILLVNIEATI